VAAGLNELVVADLVSRARRGDGAAFAELIRRHERLALGVAYGVLNDAQLSGDVVQEAFLKAWRRLGDLAQAGCFASWLCGIVRNLSVDQRRRRRLAVCGIEEARGEADGRAREPVDEMNRRELGERVRPQIEDARRRLSSFNEQAVSYIKENPGQCVLGALALGYIVGKIARR